MADCSRTRTERNRSLDVFGRAPKITPESVEEKRLRLVAGATMTEKFGPGEYERISARSILGKAGYTASQLLSLTHKEELLEYFKEKELNPDG